MRVGYWLFVYLEKNCGISVLIKHILRGLLLDNVILFLAGSSSLPDRKYPKRISVPLGSSFSCTIAFC
jgi:hypothetical protein